MCVCVCEREIERKRERREREGEKAREKVERWMDERDTRQKDRKREIHVSTYIPIYPSIDLPNVRMFIFNRDDIWSFKIVLQNTILRSSLLLLFLSNININNRDQLTLSIGWY